jgi:hypothetical protein
MIIGGSTVALLRHRAVCAQLTRYWDIYVGDVGDVGDWVGNGAVEGYEGRLCVM